MADVAQAEDADHPLALVDYRQPADLERLHMPHCLGEVIVMMNARRFIQSPRRRAAAETMAAPAQVPSRS